MEMILCPNCDKLTGYKRVIGFGTFFAVILTAGLWLLTLPFYPKRCITCGLEKSDSVPWYRTWRLGFVLVFGAIGLGTAIYKFLPHRSSASSSTPPSIALLGFQQSAHDAGLHAAAIGFRLRGCEDKGDGFRYCHYVREQDETLSLIFWRDELQTIEYDFGIRHYDSLRKELSAKYGKPQTAYEPHDPTSKLSDDWISEGGDISLIEVADHSGGVATLTFRGGKFDEFMKKTYPIPPKPPDIPSQALPKVKKAEQRLFGEKTADVEALEVTSEAVQGTIAVTTRCKAHFCADHYAVWTVDLSTGEAAGALADESEVVVYLGDYGSADNLPPVLLSEIQQQREEGIPSPKRVRYVSQPQ